VTYVPEADVARSRAMAAKLKALIEHAQTVREEFHKVRQTHVQRIEDEQREREQQEKTEDNPDQADEAEPEATHQASTTASQTASQSRQGMKKFLRAGSAAPQAFSTEKLTKLKSQKAQSSEVKAKDALQTHEEKKRFEALPKQEQIKRSVWRRGVSARDLKKYLNEELDQEQACLGLIWAVLMLWFFCMGAFSHMRLEEAHAQEFAVIFDIQENANFAFSGSVPHENGRMGHKTMNDINSIPDFWSWMNLGFVPLLFPAEGSWDTDEMRANVGTMCNSYKAALEGFGGYDDDMLSGTTDTTGIHGNMNTDSGCPEAEAPGPAWPEGFLGAEGQQGHTYLYYHSIVGGARMQQEYMPVKSCPDEVFHGSLFSGNCVPGMEPNYMLEPEPQQAFFPYDTQYLNTSTRVFLKAHTSQADLRAQLRELEDQVWLSPHTAKVEIVYTTYNPHLNSMTLTFINFFMNRAGHIHKVIEPISFFLQPYNTWSDYVWDVLWCVMVVKLAFDEIPDLYSNIRLHGGCRAGLKKYMSLGNMVDWLNIVYSCFICAAWFVHLARIQRVNDILEVADVTVPGSWQTDEERNEFFTRAVGVVQWQYMFRRIISFYPLLVVFKFLKVCSYSPRLALMTETLSKASVDIFHFAVVFFTVFLIYTISGMLLFGQELLMFSTTERALDATFKIVMGDFDWEEMRRIGRLEAWIWFVTFMLLVNLIMLNMLIAIIMDVYAEVKSSLPADADTLWSQLYEVIDRKTAVYYYGTRVSLKSIHANLHLRDDDERQSKDEDSKEPHDLDIVRFIVMAPEDGDEFKEITFAFHFKADDGSVEFELDDFSGELYVKSVSDSGSSIAVRLMEDGTEYDRKSDEAIFQPCYESYQVIRVLWGPVQATDGQEMVDAIEAARAAKAPVRITIKKSGGEAIEGTHDIEGLTNTLRKIKVSSYQAKIVLEAALKHAEAGLTNGSSISENNNRIAKVSDTLWEVQVLARGNWDLVKPSE